MHVLIALIVALATVPGGAARAMPMAAGMAGVAHCASCPRPDPAGTNPGKMPACKALACAGAVATLPSPTLLPERVVLHADYVAAAPVRWTYLARPPDPFPPRLTALD